MRMMMSATINSTWTNPPMVVLVTNPNSHRMIITTAMVYNIGCSFQLVADSVRAGAFPHQPTANRRLVLRDDGGDDHVIDHALHAIDVGGELGDEIFLGGILGIATQ